MTRDDQATSGCFGKMPLQGDFVSRGLPSVFVDVWDHWLQEAMMRSRNQLGASWLDWYLASPIWRFVLSAGICGDHPWIGLLMPSVDRVGRYFPLTLASRLPATADLGTAFSDGKFWFAEAERLALSCLRDDFDLDSFDKKLRALAFPLISFEQNTASEHVFDPSSAEDMHTEIRFLECLLAQHPGFGVACSNERTQYTIWCTRGSEQVLPSILLCGAFPPPEGFAAFLDGQWRRWGWQEERLTVATDKFWSSETCR